MLEWMWREGNPLALLVGMEIDTATRDNTGDSFKKKQLGIKPPYDQTTPLLGTYPEKSRIGKTHEAQCTCVQCTLDVHLQVNG